jgi:formylglycine-generating enzyme required for sulfatase activity
VKFDMVPIPGGKFTMGSPEGEEGRKDDEDPQHDVAVEPFWMGKCEVTWDEYEQWSMGLDAQRRRIKQVEQDDYDGLADAITRPTMPYTDMTFDMGKEGRPAICMTQLAARVYCKWLSAKTGRYYRLATEAEWEYACRAGSKTAYSFGDDPEKLGEYAWYYDNSDEKYQKVGTKKPNAWGLYDMHGNVAEWVLDQYVPDIYSKAGDKLIKNPLVVPKTPFPRCVRGGSWDEDAEALRSATRRGSTKDWNMQDPQIPQSIWYHTDADFVGFRVIRPLVTPDEEKAKLYEPEIEVIKEYKEAHAGKQ